LVGNGFNQRVETEGDNEISPLLHDNTLSNGVILRNGISFSKARVRVNICDAVVPESNQFDEVNNPHACSSDVLHPSAPSNPEPDDFLNTSHSQHPYNSSGDVLDKNGDGIDGLTKCLHGVAILIVLCLIGFDSIVFSLSHPVVGIVSLSEVEGLNDRVDSHNSPDTVGCSIEGWHVLPTSTSGAALYIGYGTSVERLDSAVVSVSLGVGLITGIFALDEGHQVGANRHGFLEYSPADTFGARWGSERALITEERAIVEGIDEVLKRYHSVGSFVVCFCLPVSAIGPDILDLHGVKECISRCEVFSALGSVIGTGTVTGVEHNTQDSVVVLEVSISHFSLLSSHESSSFGTNFATRGHDHVCFEVVVFAINSVLGRSVHMNLCRVVCPAFTFSSVKSDRSITVIMEASLVF